MARVRKPLARRNFAALLTHSIGIRIGWCFKVESLIVPGFVSLFTSADWVFGIFPFCARAGEMLPPLLFTRYTGHWARKRGLLVALTLLMAISWVSIAPLVWLLRPVVSARALLALFVALYASFWISLGLSRLMLGALTGKLLPVHQRGLLLSLTWLVGGVASIAATVWVRHLLSAPGDSWRRYATLFAIAGGWFALAAVAALGLREPAYPGRPTSASWRRHLGSAFVLLRRSRDFRLLATCLWCTAASQSLVAFYTVYARKFVHVTDSHIGSYALVQVLVGSGAMFVSGLAADRWGNRGMMRLLSAGLVLLPLLPWLTSFAAPAAQTAWYGLVYVCIGAIVPIRWLGTNYLLELAPVAEQQRYLGSMNFLVASTMLAPVLVGVLLQWVSYELMFAGFSVVGAIAVTVVWRMAEPRQRTAADHAE